MAIRLFLLSWIALTACARQQVLSTTKDQGILRHFVPSSDDELQRLVQLSAKHDLDIWHSAKGRLDIYFPDVNAFLPPFLANVDSSSSFPSNNIQKQPRLPLESWDLTSLANATFHEAYHPLYEIDQFLIDLVELHPSKATLVNLGHSGEGREMLGIKISTPSSNSTGRVKPDRERQIDPTQKLGFVIVGAQHAREWVATAASLHIAHALLSTNESYALSPLLDNYDFYIIPAPNPDGYDYTWETDRFWYKNRQVVTPRGKCAGLDMNRNWGYKWSPESPAMAQSQPSKASYHSNDQSEYADADLVEDLGKKKKKKKGGKGKKKQPTLDPCSHWFPGHRAFEAPEVNNIANFVNTLPNLVAFLDLRSYGQMLSAPYSFSCKKAPKDAEDQIEAAMGAAQALSSVHGTHFTTGTLCELLYRAPGNMVDWMYKRGGIKYSYAVHLRDTGTYGFSLPPEWIRPTGEETGQLVSYLAGFIARKLKRTT